MYDPDDLLKVFGTTITDRISLTEYKNFRENKYEPCEVTCATCSLEFMTSRPAWGYKPRPVAIYCEWCRELVAVEFAKRGRYSSQVRYWSPEEETEPEWIQETLW